MGLAFPGPAKGQPGWLDPEVYPPVAFVDVDGVLFREGTDEWLPGALDYLRALNADKIRVVLFTSRAPGTWLNRFAEEGVVLFGAIQKPLASGYFVVDDRLMIGRCASGIRGY